MSDEFKQSEEQSSMWRAYSMVSGMTGSTILGAVSLSLYMKDEDASKWWLMGAIFGGLGAIGSIYSLIVSASATDKSEEPQNFKGTDKIEKPNP